MNKYIKMAFASACCVLFAQCSDFLETSSPSNTDDEFVTSSPAETLKTLSRAYALYRESCNGAYDWNDHYRSDIEYFPENNTSNNINAKLVPEQIPCDHMKGSFNALYNVISYAGKTADLIAAKTAYQDDIAAGRTSDWTHLKGEAEALRALCYFDLIKHCGDVPYGYENNYVDDYGLASRFDIYDALIEKLKAAEPYMYKVGEGGLNGERITRTFVDGLIGKMALYAGGYQTIRTDMPELYGSVQFETLSTDAKRKCAYARRSDYKNYYTIAEDYLQKALSTNAVYRIKLQAVCIAMILVVALTVVTILPRIRYLPVYVWCRVSIMVVMITLINVAMSVQWLPGWMVKAMSWHLLLRRVLRLMEVFA